MPSYWWHCDQCDKTRTFEEECGIGIVRFLWDELLLAQWDQKLLVHDCAACQSPQSLRITYDFPRKDKETLHVMHIVGMTPDREQTYLPMLWQASMNGELFFDFKYMNGRSNWGLNKPAVLTDAVLTGLIRLYREKANSPTFLRDA